MTIRELREKWEEVDKSENGFIRIDAVHPLELYVGYQEMSQKTLLVVDAVEIKDLPSSRSITARSFKRHDGRWTFSFTLKNPESEDEFTMLCWDMIEASRQASSDRVKALVSRYRSWQRLLERDRPDLLDAMSQKGLLGEILFLRTLFPKQGFVKAIESWVGPEMADQDFVFDGTWAEIKSVGRAADTVQISSLEQLSNKARGWLVLYLLDKSSATDSNSITLSGTIEEVRSILRGDGEAFDKFELRLLQSGYTENKAYEEIHYSLSGSVAYQVDDGFPKLIRQNVPDAVVSAKYALSIASIASYKQQSGVSL